MKRLLLISLIVLFPFSTQALLFCTRPEPPWCLHSLGTANRFDFDSCRSEMETYRLNVQQYVACLRKEQSTVLDELDEAIRKFNACANSRYC